MAAPTEQGSILPKEAESALQTLALHWADVIDEKMEITPLTGSMTNKIFKCSWQTREEENSRKVLVQIYGDSRVNVFFDQEYEIRVFECISRLGQGPCLLAFFPNGRIEEFLNSKHQSGQKTMVRVSAMALARAITEFVDWAIADIAKGMEKFSRFLHVRLQICITMMQVMISSGSNDLH